MGALLYWPHVGRVVIGHPRTNAWIAKDPNKSDSVDAFKLAELLRLGRVHEVYYTEEQPRRIFKQLVQRPNTALFVLDASNIS